ERIRANDTLARSAQESEIREIPGTDLSSSAAAMFSGVTDAQYEDMVEEAGNALSRVLTGSIPEGEVDAARDRAEDLLSATLTAPQRRAIMELIGPLIVPTLVEDAARTRQQREDAMASTPPVQVSYEQGEVVVPDGGMIDAEDVEALEQLGIRQT